MKTSSSTFICRKIALFIFASMFLLLKSVAAPENESDSSVPDHKDSVIVESHVVTAPVFEVTGVVSNHKHTDQANLEDELTLQISNMDQFIEKSKKENKKILLYINGTPVADATLTHKRDGLSFLLVNKGDVLTLWGYLLETRGKGEFFQKRVSITVGLEGDEPIYTHVSESKKAGAGFTFNVVVKSWFWISIIMIILLVGVFLMLAKRTDILRDTSAQPPVGRKPYSLARIQMAVWTLAITTSWLFLYVCSQHFNLLAESTLVLMGITASTGIGGLVMDSKNSVVSLQPSQGFFHDLVSGSLFRFQNLIWTFILVIVFLRSVLIYLQMPEFDEKLLLLMGISSGTYLGAKATEKPAAVSTPVETENLEKKES